LQRFEDKKYVWTISVDRVRRIVRTFCRRLSVAVQKLRQRRQRPLRSLRTSRARSVSLRVRRERPSHARHQEPARSERRPWQRERFVQPGGTGRFYPRGRVYSRPRTRF